jgi:acetylornithine deacetylase
VGNRLYGRGAVDDKSGLVANYFALRSLLRTGVKPQGTVILESVVEEDGGAGSLASLLNGFTADGIIFSDSLPAIVVGIVGSTVFRVRVKGSTMHAGWADPGVNAILKMTPSLLGGYSLLWRSVR